MAIDPKPWFSEMDGATHSSSVARTLAYSATSGAEGIISSYDLRVLAQATPGNSVRVMPGAGVMLNKYASGGYESYIGRNRSTTNVSITATGSSGGRTDLVIMRILDPGFEGAMPSDPNTFDVVRLTVIQGVSANLKDIDSLNLDYPAIALAKITLPKSTATVTQSMITDMRNVANPRQKELVYPRPNVTNDAGMTLTSRSAYPDGEWMPNVGGELNTGAYYIDIPKWATRMQIRCEWLSVEYKSNPGAGYYWVTYGPDAGSSTPSNYTQGFGWDSDDTTNRVNWILHQEVDVKPEWRGTTQPFVPRANKTTNTSYPGTVRLTARSGMVFSVRFLEYADQEYGL